MPQNLDLLETRRGDMPMVPPPPMPGMHVPPGTPGAGTPMVNPMMHAPGSPYPQPAPNHAVERVAPVAYPQVQPNVYPTGATTEVSATRGSTKWIVWIVVLLALGAGVGAVLALVLR
jgi:hypothetical protein